MSWQEDLAVLRAVRGDLYRQRRDAFLGAVTPQIRASLEQAATSPDPAQATTAAILVGWMEHGELYRSILAELDALDAKTISSSKVGFDMVWNDFAERAKETWRETILPLSWERVTRFTGEVPVWHTITFLRMIRAVPDARSVDPVIVGLESTSDHASGEPFARTLSALPREATRPRVELGMRKHDVLLGLYQKVDRETKA